MLHLLEAS